MVTSIENGIRVYPCRCGTTHRGDGASELFMRHECYHDRGLAFVGNSRAACQMCGESFGLYTFPDLLVER